MKDKEELCFLSLSGLHDFIIISDLLSEKIWKGNFSAFICIRKNITGELFQNSQMKMRTSALSLLLLVPFVLADPTCKTVVTKVTGQARKGAPQAKVKNRVGKYLTTCMQMVYLFVTFALICC